MLKGAFLLAIFLISLRKEEVNLGNVVKIDMQVSEINVKEGINVVEANLEYDETMFESATFESSNEWKVSYNQEDGENKGKFVVAKLVKGVTQGERIGQIQLKLKDDVKEMKTKIKINNIVSNDGTELIEEGNQVIEIKVVKPKVNIDTDGDGKPDLNIDTDGDGIPDGNVNSNGTQKGEKNNGQDTNKNPQQTIYSQGNHTATKDVEGKGDLEDPKGMKSIIGDNIKTGDKIVLVITIAILLIGINLIYFMIKRKQLQKEGNEKYSKKYWIVIMISIVLMMLIMFLAKDVIAFTEQDIETMTEALKEENGNNPESTEYLVTDKTISRIPPNTTVKMLKEKLEGITVSTKEDEKLREVKNQTEIIKTGMIAKYMENGRTYEISVLGDMNGDGKLDQIDLTREIREYVKSETSKIEKETEKLSADLTCDGSIDKADLNSIIHYIVYGKLEEIKPVEPVEPPTIEVVAGKEVATGRYITGVTMKITQENEQEKTAKTVYKITGTKTIEEKQVNQGETIELAEGGIYKITGYTYGIDGNKSKESYQIIVIEEPPEIKINHINTWTNQDLTIAIEGKEGYEIEYKINDDKWVTYEKEFQIKENCTITARIKKGDIYGIEVVKKITNIDQEKPTGRIEVTGKGTSKIAFMIEAQDTQLSGMKEIRVYAKEKMATDYECKATYSYEEDQDKNQIKQESLVMKELKAGTEYDLYLEVEDIAGNILNKKNTEANESTTIQVATEEMATPVIITTPEEWTNEGVKVTIEGEEGYQLQYKVNDHEWNAYTQEFEVVQNGTITARLIENENVENIKEVSKEIKNIDQLPPNPFTPVATSTTNSITITGETSDATATNENASSGIEKYYFSKDNGVTWEPTEGQVGTTYIFSNLTQNTSYSIKMKAVDHAGNEMVTNVMTKATESIPSLRDDSNTTFSYSTTAPTNKDVKVTITTTAGSGYTLQYSKDQTNWYDYTTAVTMSENGNIYARLKDRIGQVGEIATGKVENIDKLAPNTFTPTATSTTNSITMTGSTTDQAKTTTNASSGIAKYYFSKDNGATWLPTGGQTGTSYTFSGLTQNTSYSLKMKAVDNAGNETITNAITKTTGNVPSLTEANVTFTYSTTNPTNQNVTVTITTTAQSNCNLQYSKDGTSWTNYTTPVSMSQNGDIYARLWDGTNSGGTVTGNVSNIDKLVPNTFTPTANSTTNSITITGSTTDQAETTTNASSGIAKYYFSKDNGATWSPTGGQTGTSYTFSGLTQNTSYSLKMKAVDRAGNERITNTVTKTTGSVPSLTEANVTFTYSTTNPTNQDVTVTITTTLGNGYTLQYSKDGTNWTNYTSAITMSQNGSVYARLKDSTGQVGGTATGNVLNIDKLSPNTPSVTASSTQNSITVTASATDQARTSTNACSGIGGYSFSINNGTTWSDWQESGTYTFENLTATSYTIKVKAKDRAGNESTVKTITKELVTLSLSSTSGTVVDGSSVNVTVNGSNYGTLSCSSSDASIATASLSGSTLTITGKNNTSGTTKNATITVTGSNGGSATYTVRAHKHSSYGGSCYKSSTTTGTCGRSLSYRTGTTTESCGGTIVTCCSGGTYKYLRCDVTSQNGYFVGKTYWECDTCGVGATHVVTKSTVEEATAFCESDKNCVTQHELHKCNKCWYEYSSSYANKTCTKSVQKSYSYYTCDTHGGSYSTSGNCRQTTTSTSYSINCGF